ncbi:MAG: insulinase family protein [Vulcanimicrobiaceae bacterium]
MTRVKTAAAAICVGISLLSFSPPSARAAAEVPQESGQLPGGGAYVVNRDGTVGNAVIELWFRAPGAGYEGTQPGMSRLAITAVAASRPAPHDTSLAEAVKYAGGRLSINAYPDIVSVGVSVPAASAGKIVRAMTHTYFVSNVSADGLKDAQRDAAVAVAEKRFSADRTIHDLLLTQLFASGPAHFPATPDSMSGIERISLDDVRAFARRAFRRANAVLTIAGNVDPGVTASVWEEQAASDGASMDAPFDSQPASAPQDKTQPGAAPGAGLAWLGPAIVDTRAATALDFIADYLFNTDSGLVTKAADEIDPDSFVNGQFVTLHNPGVMLVTISSSKAATVRQKVLDAIDTLAQPLDAHAFAAARNAFEYHILSDVQTPVNQADNFGWFTAEGNPRYAPGDASQTYIHNVESLDPQFVAQVVRTYLKHPTVVEVTAAGHPQDSTQ